MIALNRPAYVYMLTNHRKSTLYVGVTTELKRRITDHKNGTGSKFAARYNVNQLVYLEDFDSIVEAIQREKRLKSWNRAWKERLIDEFNPEWKDLAWDIIYST